MNSKTWLLGIILGATTGTALKIFCPQISGLGVTGIALIVTILSVRLAEAWKESA